MKHEFLTASLLACSIFLVCCNSTADHVENPPNVILVMTDDQGIGDLSCHGNPWLSTPNIDEFYAEAVRMTDFHVSPVCTPTRSAIMTGRYPINNGAWATYKGRDALSKGAYTLAQLFRDSGYRTGIFGKWHLGDNYPVRATDCGFEIAVHHKAGGVGELSDYWGNNYADDTYYVNNEVQEFEGYCTDVWFDQAMTFMAETKTKPFFTYISTNAPHSPFIVDESYAAPYQHLVGNKIVNAEFYGMLANIDENFGKLEEFLNQQELADNTILIFMTDNGSGGGVSKDGLLGHNHGFRGSKGHYYEGGHRVPFFIRWKDGQISGGRDINDLTAHIDILPTLTSLCNLNPPENLQLDGVDFSDLLKNEKENLEPRTVFVHNSQDWRPPSDSERSCIMNEKWRLVNGTELYDIEEDRHQDNNLASSFPEVVNSMLEENSHFVAKAKQNWEYAEFPVNTIGNDNQKIIKLTIQHAIGESAGIWKSEHVSAGMKNVNNTHAIEVDKAGTYLISCRRWPLECPGSILGVPDENPKGGIYTYEPIAPDKVRIQIANQRIEKEIGPEDQTINFEVKLDKGKSFLINDFLEGDESYGVYYTYIEYLDNPKSE